MSMLPEVPFDRIDNRSGHGDLVPHQSGNISDGFGESTPTFGELAISRMIESGDESSPLLNYLSEQEKLMQLRDRAPSYSMKKTYEDKIYNLAETHPQLHAQAMEKRREETKRRIAAAFKKY